MPKKEKKIPVISISRDSFGYYKIKLYLYFKDKKKYSKKR